MKKVFKLAAMAIAVVGLMTACKQNAPEEAIDTTPVDTMVVEEVMDTVDTVEAVVAEEPVKKAVKATVKEEAPADPNAKAADKKGNTTTVTLQTAKGQTVEVKSENAKPTNVKLQTANAKPTDKNGDARK